jgi:SH3 domain protein
MNQQIRKLRMALVIVALYLPLTSWGQSAWVSDQFEITLRTGPSTTNAIERMLSSGTELAVLEQDAESGYSHVRTTGGTEGWVLTRYLMDEPSAREQLERLTQQLTSASAEGASMTSQLSAIRGQYETATRTISQLEQDKTGLQAQLDDITRKAANTLAIDEQNQRLQQQLTDADIRISLLEQENEQLTGQTNRNWFIAGALVLFGGVLLGLILPRLKFQRRSRYDRF